MFKIHRDKKLQKCIVGVYDTVNIKEKKNFLMNESEALRHDTFPPSVSLKISL